MIDWRDKQTLCDVSASVMDVGVYLQAGQPNMGPQ
jgi:hypothetical protein